jgi:hypothetical protein
MCTLTSCNDYLDVKPTTEVDRDELFLSEEGYADALAGVYGDMTKTDLYGRNITWYCLDLFAGYYKSPYYGTNNFYSQYLYKHNNQNRNENVITTIDAFWSNIYTEISNLNSILATIDRDKGNFTGDNYKVIKGEALGLRAFLHFDLLRMFGQPYSTGKDSLSIPYVNSLTTKVTKLSTVDSVLTHIITDLEEAKTLMTNDPMKLGTTPSAALASTPSGSYAIYNIPVWHNRRFHFNYYAAAATLARAYLWKGDKSNALAQAKEIIDVQKSKFPWVANSNLTTIGTDNVNQDRTFATEQIFALNIRKATFEDNMDGYMYFKSTALSSSQNVLSGDKSIYEDYTTDPRYQYLLTLNSKKYLLSKFYQNASVASFFQERLPLIRMSEMYYIAAECASNVATGVTYLNAVRANRGLSARPLAVTISQNELTSEIKKEYRKELFGEGQMWFYYKRTLAESIPNMWSFGDISLYTFDRPSDEDLYGGR